MSGLINNNKNPNQQLNQSGQQVNPLNLLNGFGLNNNQNNSNPYQSNQFNSNQYQKNNGW
jgi:hypothetical protein